MKQSARTEQEQADELLKQARKLEREERQAVQRAAATASDQRCWEEIGQRFFGREVHAIVYMKAYEDGHASGYEEVFGAYRDLADFVCRIQQAK